MPSSGLHRHCAHVLGHKHIHNFKILKTILINNKERQSPSPAALHQYREQHPQEFLIKRKYRIVLWYDKQYPADEMETSRSTNNLKSIQLPWRHNEGLERKSRNHKEQVLPVYYVHKHRLNAIRNAGVWMGKPWQESQRKPGHSLVGLKSGPLWCQRKTNKSWRQGTEQKSKCRHQTSDLQETEMKMSRGRNLFKEQQLSESQNWHPTTERTVCKVTRCEKRVLFTAPCIQRISNTKRKTLT